MSSRKTAGRRGTTKKRAQRATSNVFAMFNQDQIQEFKEAFNMIDQVNTWQDRGLGLGT
jgi:myosin regulatory light chain 12